MSAHIIADEFGKIIVMGHLELLQIFCLNNRNITEMETLIINPTDFIDFEITITIEIDCTNDDFNQINKITVRTK